MKEIDKTFVEETFKEVVLDNLKCYREMYLDRKIPSDAKGAGVKKILFVQNLNSEDREILFSLLSQVTIDSISSIFGIIDGSSYLDKFSGVGEFSLKYGGNLKKKISGDLQSLFLEYVEHNYKED